MGPTNPGIQSHTAPFWNILRGVAVEAGSWKSRRMGGVEPAASLARDVAMMLGRPKTQSLVRGREWDNVWSNPERHALLRMNPTPMRQAARTVGLLET